MRADRQPVILAGIIGDVATLSSMNLAAEQILATAQTAATLFSLEEQTIRNASTPAAKVSLCFSFLLL